MCFSKACGLWQNRRAALGLLSCAVQPAGFMQTAGLFLQNLEISYETEVFKVQHALLFGGQKFLTKGVVQVSRGKVILNQN